MIGIVKVKESCVRFRDRPNGKILGTWGKFQVLSLWSEKGDWCQVSDQDGVDSGWTHADYLARKGELVNGVLF
jgi:hypothetical protein